MTYIRRGSFILERGQDLRRHALSSAQLQLDASLSSFVSSATDSSMLASMMIGGLVGRALKFGVLSSSSHFLTRPLAQGISVLGEATAFEASHRSLQVLRGIAPNEVLQWGGEFGLARGIQHSAISFATLNAAGHLVKNSNVIARHSLQSAAFVASHEIAASLGLQAHDERNWVDQLFFAEMTNLQLEASRKLLNLSLPKLALFERRLDFHTEAALQRLQMGVRTKSFRALPRMLTDVPDREGEVVQVIQLHNSEGLLGDLLLHKGKHLKLVSQTLGEEGNLSVMRLWYALQPHAEDYLSLRLELPGLVFRYGEFPGEANQKGTLIEVDPNKGSFEEINHGMQAFLEVGKRENRIEATERSARNRSDMPENIAYALREAIYQRYSTMRQWHHAAAIEVIAMNEQLKRNEALSGEQKRQLNEIQAKDAEWMKEFQLFHKIWRWLDIHQLAGRGEDIEGPSIKQVLHDLNNRLSALMTLSAELSFISMGRVVDEGLIHANQNSTHLSISSAVNEGIGMATVIANRAGIQVDSLSGVPHRFQQVLLGEDPHIEFALMDVMGNLLSNALRYSDPSKDQKFRLPQITAHFLREGDLEITVFDHGIGILPENFARLGEEGFREARKEVAGSSGHGIASVIQILRDRSWGPLWVRSEPGKGSAFRFVIPKTDFTRSAEFVADRQHDEDTWRPGDPLFYVERNLNDGFRVPPASLDMARAWVEREIPASMRDRRENVLNRLSNPRESLPPAW